MQALVGIIMGSKSDWETMSHAAATLETLSIPFEVRVLSAHRTPDQLFEYVESADGRGIEVIIAAAGGAAHLAGVAAAKTLLPVLRSSDGVEVVKGFGLSVVDGADARGDSRSDAGDRKTRCDQCGAFRGCNPGSQAFRVSRGDREISKRAGRGDPRAPGPA